MAHETIYTRPRDPSSQQRNFWDIRSQRGTTRHLYSTTNLLALGSNAGGKVDHDDQTHSNLTPLGPNAGESKGREEQEDQR